MGKVLTEKKELCVSMKTIWNILGLAQKKLIVSIPLSMLLGLAIGYFFNVSFLKSLIVPFTILMVYPMMVTLNIKELFNFSKADAKLQLSVQIINFAIIPFLGFGVGYLFFRQSPAIILGLLLTSLLPTSGMTISWTGFAKGNVHAAVKMTVIGLLLGSILTPIYVKALMGTVVTFSLMQVFSQILFIVFIPLIAGYLTQIFIIKVAGKESYDNKIKQKFPMVSTVGVLAIVFISMALKAKNIFNNPIILLYYLLPIALIYITNFIFSTIIGKLLFSKEDAIALVYGTVMRNLSIALAIAMSAFGDKGSDIALIIALAYIIQVQAAAWYVKFTGRIFGRSHILNKQNQ